MAFPRLTAALVYLAEFYPRQTITPALLDGYLDALQDLPVERVEQAVRTHVRTGQWFPSVAELRALAADLELALPSDDEALRQLEAYVTAVGLRRSAPRPVCPDCDGRGEVPQTPGQPGDGPTACPECGGTGDRPEPLPALHPAVRDALDLVGGYLGYTEATEPTVVRGQFLRLFRSAAARQTRQAQVGELPTGPLHPSIPAPDLRSLPS